MDLILHIKIKGCLWNTTVCPQRQQSWKSYFLLQGQSQGHKVNDLVSKIKGHHKWSMHAKYEVSISYGSKVIAKVKVDNRQTDKQTDRQDKNNMPLIIRSRGIKMRSCMNIECHKSAHIIGIAKLKHCKQKRVYS